MKKHIILIVGKTRSGKDTLAKYLSTKYNIPFVCSFTTRPKRVNETNGVEHYFITNAEMDNLLKTKSVIVYTQCNKTNFRYCATVDSLSSDKVICIIEPSGELVGGRIRHIKSTSERKIIV